MNCQDTAACRSDAMRNLPQVGGLAAPNRWYGKAGCGLIVCEDGTYEEANEAVVAHRDAVRAEHVSQEE